MSERDSLHISFTYVQVNFQYQLRFPSYKLKILDTILLRYFHIFRSKHKTKMTLIQFNRNEIIQSNCNQSKSKRTTCSKSLTAMSESTSTMEKALALHLACVNGASRKSKDTILLRDCNSFSKEFVQPDVLGINYSDDNQPRISLYVKNEAIGSSVSEITMDYDDEPHYHESRCGTGHSSLCISDNETKSSKLTYDLSNEGYLSLPLTCDNLSKKQDVENGLISRRNSLKIKHAHDFTSLRQEIDSVLEEKTLIRGELKKSEDELSKLHEQYSNERKRESQLKFERRRSLITRFRQNLQFKNLGAGDIEYNMGIASIQKSDLERYYYELEERYVQLKEKYSYLNRDVFSEIDRQIEVTLCVHMNGKN